MCSSDLVFMIFRQNRCWLECVRAVLCLWTLLWQDLLFLSSFFGGTSSEQIRKNRKFCLWLTTSLCNWRNKIYIHAVFSHTILIAFLYFQLFRSIKLVRRFVIASISIKSMERHKIGSGTATQRNWFFKIKSINKFCILQLIFMYFVFMSMHTQYEIVLIFVPMKR